MSMRSQAQRRFMAECAAMAVVAVLWLGSNAELARTIVRLGQSLQLVTVAEGVEDSAQFLALRRMGCDVGQGFYFGKPMASEEVSRMLRDDAPAPARKPATTG